MPIRTTAICPITESTANPRIGQQEKEQNGAACGEEAASLFAACVGGNKVGQEPCPGQETVNGKTEAHGS